MQYPAHEWAFERFLPFPFSSHPAYTFIGSNTAKTSHSITTPTFSYLHTAHDGECDGVSDEQSESNLLPELSLPDGGACSVIT